MSTKKSLSQYIFRILTVFSLIPIILVVSCLMFLNYYNYSRLTSDTANRYIDNINTMLTDYYHISQIVIEEIEYKLPGDLILDYEGHVKELLIDLVADYYEIENVYITFSNSISYYRTRIYEKTEYDPTTRPFYHAAMANKDQMVIVGPYHGFEQDFINKLNWDVTLSKYRRVSDSLDSVINVDINIDTVQEYITKLPLEPGSHIILLNDKKEIMFSNDHTFFLSLIKNPEYQSYLLSSSNKATIYDILYSKFLYTNPQTNISMVYLSPVKNNIRPFFNNLVIIGLLLMIIIIIMIFLSSKTQRTIMKKVLIIKDTIQQVGKSTDYNGTDCYIKSPDGVPDEVDAVISTLNEMIHRICVQTNDLEKKNTDIADQFDIINNLYKDAHKLNEELNLTNIKLSTSYKEMIMTLSQAIEQKDPHTKGHSQRVSEYALMLGEKLNLTNVDLDKLEVAALLHDIGKIIVDLSIINKKDDLEDHEYDSMKAHPEAGKVILSGITYFDDIPEIVAQHHERPDGKGYPNGYSNGQIHKLAYILSVADAFDVMTSLRPYKERSFSLDEAMNELIKYRGTQFKADVVDAMVELIKSDAIII